jgi:hypothetical protein
MAMAIIIFFILAAILGVILLTYVLSNRLPPKPLAALHGTFAATGLILLLIHAAKNMENQLFFVAALFAITALAGFYMVSRHLMGHTIPKSVAIVHGSLAVLAFILLIFYMFFSQAN